MRDAALVFDEIDRHRKENPEHIGFAGGVDETWIRMAEDRLGVRFSSSFRHYLRTFGGGTVGGETINGLLGVPFEEACGPDIVFNTLLDREQRQLDPRYVVLVDNDGDEFFYLDTARETTDGESPVVRVEAEAPEVFADYADSFAEFLLARIEFSLAGKAGRTSFTR